MPSPEELKALLKIRGLEKGFARTPLREFRGKLESYIPNIVERFQPPRTEVTFNFTEVEITAEMEPPTEPYPFPIAQISIFHSSREQSYWGIFADSVAKLIPADQELPYLVGKVCQLKMTPGHMMWDRDKGAETPRECWELVGLEGVTVATPHTGGAPAPATPATKGTSSTQRALELLDGKSEQEWYQTVFQDPTVKADGDLVNQLIQRTFLAPLVEADMVYKDENGIYHVAK